MKADDYFKRGTQYYEDGNYDGAIAEYTEAIQLNPCYVPACRNWRLLWSKKGEFGKAIADFDEVIRLKPNNADAFTIRGAAWGQNKALRINPNNQHTFHNHSFELALKNHAEEA